MSKLSRRSLVASAAALPALAVPALAASVADTSTTLPPDLIERFVRLRAWHVENSERYRRLSEEIDRRFYSATGITFDEWRDIMFDDPRRKKLDAVHSKIWAEVAPDADEEADELHDERWGVADAMMAHKPQTFADLAWQAEAYLIADLELLDRAPSSDSWMLRTLFHNIRMLGAIPQPNDPLGILSINTSRVEA
jgi:hypothetical protein